jgi:hypothetical protein
LTLGLARGLPDDKALPKIPDHSDESWHGACRRLRRIPSHRHVIPLTVTHP